MNEAFDIYRIGMEVEVFLQDGIMSPRTYSNIVMSGLRAKAHEWIFDFIFTYKSALPEKQREGFFNYNLAQLYYSKKDYEKAMPLLQMMEYEDVLLTCLGKILLAKMQFELRETEPLVSHLQSFKTYVKRKKMLGYHRDSSLNFIQFTNKLLHESNGRKEKLAEEIRNTQIVAEKKWLLEQMEEAF